MLDAGCGLAGPETGETKYWLRYSRRAQLNRLFRERNAKPFRAFFHEPASTLDRAVAISIRLDHRHHARFRTHALPDALEVGGKTVEIDLGPGWAPGKHVS